MKNLFVLLFLALFSCKYPDNNSNPDISGLSYAKGFECKEYATFKILSVKNPWQKSQGEIFSYVLTHSPETVPDSLRKNSIIKTPVQRIIVFSSTHVGFIAALGKSRGIVGVSGKDFINDSTVRSSLGNKQCLDIGFAPNIDFESILLLRPDVVFLYGLDPSVISLVKRLEESGIKSVLVSEFLETHPLGKAEWIKFFATFFELEQAGDSLFDKVEVNYLDMKNSVASINLKPAVMVGLPWKDTWYMSGGKSFAARFIEDAGGDYLWKENENTDFIPLDLESVFQKALQADFWINTGSAESKAAVYSVDQRFQHVPAFKNGMLFNNNKRVNVSGGNDFWESGAVRPDLVLSDLIKIFHPGLLSDTALFYYQKLD